MVHRLKESFFFCTTRIIHNFILTFPQTPPRVPAVSTVSVIPIYTHATCTVSDIVQIKFTNFPRIIGLYYTMYTRYGHYTPAPGTADTHPEIRTLDPMSGSLASGCGMFQDSFMFVLTYQVTTSDSFLNIYFVYKENVACIFSGWDRFITVITN